ncbi:PilZ domain-containing protein [Photobacterium damselae]|uniref:PilZ domain-containing protein n=1 Tax=Photobacterium damselae TaxID=38293 RepID=UPI001F2CD04A|nr:PilZ domain-containing protein [Photobacterium damselae]UKA04693.1 PilZ domain-containing protein [Photobacterium damselae subsp. damselae]
MNRKIPRSACSIKCDLVLKNGDVYPCYIVDISAIGCAISPLTPSDIEKFPVGEDAEIVVDLQSTIEIDSTFKATVSIRWNEGTMIGAEVIEIDTQNFKKWWVLVYKSYFPA